jgi:lipoyl(octanoyl) transferase
MAELVYLDLGRAAYVPALAVQQRLVERVQAAEDERAYLVLAEHDPPVITIGRGGRDEHVLASPQRLAADGIELHRASRGGDVTVHGPGQLVAYPILRLDLHGRDVRRYLRDLEALVVRLLGRFGIEGRRVAGMTGVWVGQEKIAAIGVAVRRWVTYHGLAVNVGADLSYFDFIIPCGLHGKGVTSISALLGRDVPVSQVTPALIECVVETFGFEAARPAQAERF